MQNLKINGTINTLGSIAHFGEGTLLFPQVDILTCGERLSYIKVVGLVLLLIFGVSSTNCSAQETYIRIKNADKQVEAEGWILNDKKTGYWKFYNATQKVKKEGHFFNGKRVKYWKIYYPNNRIKAEGSYVAGKKQGWWKTFDTDGQLTSEGKYESDARQDFWKFYAMGELIEEGTYGKGLENNLLSGRFYTWKTYDAQGNLSSEGKYNNGKKDDYWMFYTNGRMTEEGAFTNGKKVGTWKFYHTSGKINRVVDYD